MLLRNLSRYYHYLWLIFIVIIGIKIFFSFLYNKHLEGLAGLVFAVFKWYGEEDQELAETSRRRLFMRLQNVVTVGMYFTLLMIILASILPMFLTTS